MRAMDRARVIADAAFATAEDLAVIVTHYSYSNRERRSTPLYKSMNDIGFEHAFCGPDWVRYNDEDNIQADGENTYLHFYLANFKKSEPAMTALL